MLYAAQDVERTKLSGVKLPSVVISDLCMLLQESRLGQESASVISTTS